MLGVTCMSALSDANKRKTHCKRGHPFDTANTYLSKNGRACRKCKAAQMSTSRADVTKGERIKRTDTKSWKKNKEKYYAKAQNIRHTIKEHLRKLKAASGCRFCLETDPDCLDFHHEDPSNKKFTIGGFGGWPSEKHILDEVKKCFIICANCHRKLEARKRREAALQHGL